MANKREEALQYIRENSRGLIDLRADNKNRYEIRAKNGRIFLIIEYIDHNGKDNGFEILHQTTGNNIEEELNKFNSL